MSEQAKNEACDQCALRPNGCLKAVSAISNVRALWAALAAIREYVEDIAPAGSVSNGEYAVDPNPMREAEAIIEGIDAALKAAKEPKPEPRPIMIFTGE